MDMPVLTTERLRVRRLTEDDAAACHALFVGVDWAESQATDAENRARCARWLSWTTLNYKHLAKLRQPPYGEHGVELAAGGELVGLVGFVPCLATFGELPSFGGDPTSSCSAEVGLFWLIGQPFQGNGYATEAAEAMAVFAFDVLHVGRLVATTEHDNTRSIAVMRRLGMHIDMTEHTAPTLLQVVGTLTS